MQQPPVEDLIDVGVDVVLALSALGVPKKDVLTMAFQALEDRMDRRLSSKELAQFSCIMLRGAATLMDRSVALAPLDDAGRARARTEAVTPIHALLDQITAPMGTALH